MYNWTYPNDDERKKENYHQVGQQQQQKNEVNMTHTHRSFSFRVRWPMIYLWPFFSFIYGKFFFTSLCVSVCMSKIFLMIKQQQQQQKSYTRNNRIKSRFIKVLNFFSSTFLLLFKDVTLKPWCDQKKLVKKASEFTKQSTKPQGRKKQSKKKPDNLEKKDKEARWKESFCEDDYHQEKKKIQSE